MNKENLQATKKIRFKNLLSKVLIIANNISIFIFYIFNILFFPFFFLAMLTQNFILEIELADITVFNFQYKETKNDE